jgi:outer membrane protein
MKKVILYCITGFLALASKAQQTMGLKDAVDIALRNSLNLRIGKAILDIAAINNSYGIAGGLPFVNATAGDNEQLTTLDQTYTDAASNISTSNATSNNLTAGLNASILLYNGQRVVTAKKRLGLIESQSRVQLDSRTLVLVYNVMLKYYDIVRQQSYAKTLEISIQVSRQKLDIVKAQQSVGLANNADLFQSQVDLNTQIQNLQAQQLVIDQDKTDLLTLLTLRPDSTVIIADTIIVDKQLRLDSILMGLLQNPDIVTANEQVTINQFIEKEVASQRYPSLSFGMGYNLSRSQNVGFSLYNPLLNQSYGPIAGVSLTVPIFNGNIYKKQQEIAVVNSRMAGLQKDTLVLGYTANAVKSWQAYINNLQQLETAKENYDLSQKLLNLVLQRFQLKQATIVDVKNAQQSFEDAGFLMINISYAAKAAEIQLKRYANRLVI